MSGFGETPGWDKPGGARSAAEIAGDVAHDLNNLLTVIGGSVALAERHAAGNPKLIRLLDAIRQAVDRGAALAATLAALSPDAAGSGMAEELAAFGPPKSHGRILVVEDDAQVAELAAAVLDALGHAVEVRADAAAALAVLRDGGKFDLVFSDIVMPGGMNGIELAEAIAASFPGLPILLATGFSAAALEPGALRFPVLAKPYSVQELGRRITQMLPAA